MSIFFFFFEPQRLVFLLLLIYRLAYPDYKRLVDSASGGGPDMDA